MRLREGLYLERERGRHDAKTYAVIDGQIKELDSQISALTRAAMQAHPELSYGSAFKMACSEHADLWRLREGFRRLLD